MPDPLEHHSWLHIEGRPLLAPAGSFEPSLWSTAITVHKWNADTVRQVMGDHRSLLGDREPVFLDFRALGVAPDDVAHEAGNVMLTTGLNLLTELFEGAGGNAFNHTDAIVGVGSGTTAATVGDTHLGGDGSTTTAWYQQADTSYPTQSNGLITVNMTAASGNANFAWQEFMLGDGAGGITSGGTFASVTSPSPVGINHKIASLGTKVSGAVWTAEITITET